jgi:O-antigen biosynthesis protein
LKQQRIIGILLAVVLAPITFSINVLAFILLSLAGALGNLHKVKPQHHESIERFETSVIIPSWNGKEMLKSCIPALVQAIRTCPGRHEIIVVDNGSTDGSANYLAENFSEVRIIETAERLGFGTAANLGINSSNKDIVVLLNNDMVVDENFLGSLLEEFKQKPDLFAVTSQIFFWDKDKRREETGKTGAVMRNGNIYAWHNHKFKTHEVLPVTYAGGGSSAFDRRKLIELGGFDELYSPFYVEDLDLSFAAWKRGWRVLFKPESVVYHKHQGTIGTRFNSEFIESVKRRNEILFAWKNINSIDLLGVHFFWLWIRLLVRTASGSFIFTGAYLKAFTLLGPALRKRYNEATQAVISDRQVFQRSVNLSAYKNFYGPLKEVKLSEPLKILFVCPYIPFPPSHGGAVRMYNMIKQLAKEHEVFLLSFVENEQELEGNEHLQGICREVRLVLRRESWRRDSVLWLKPQSSLNEFYSQEFEVALNDMVEEHDIDIVQYEYTQMAQYIRNFPRAKNVLTEHDVTFVTRYRYLRMVPWSKEKVKAFIRWAAMYVYELNICRKFDLICTVSTNEKNLLLGYDSKLKVTDAAPTGADTTFYSPKDRVNIESNSLLFVGFFKHIPNVEGIILFLNEIYPIIKQKVPGIKLYIVGSNPPEEVRKFAEDPSIQITGFVPDLREYYAKCSAFVVPIQRGAGTRVKIFEAMAAGIPIVSTSLGAEGIAVTNEKDILLADSPETFAHTVIELLRNDHLQQVLATNARELVINKYDWASICDNLEQEYYLLWKEGVAAGDGSFSRVKNVPGPHIRFVWKILNYTLFPIGFIVLVLRVIFKMIYFWASNSQGKQKNP